MSFRQLADVSGHVARQLKKAGLEPGSAVLLLVPMSLQLYAVLVGLFRAGMVPTVLDPSAGLQHIRRCCELNRPAALIGIPKSHALRLLSGAIREIPKKFCIGAGWPFGTQLDLKADQPGDDTVIDLPYDAPALLTFTSGSTGLPKGVVRSHGFLLAQHRALQQSINLQVGQVDLTTLPIFALANLGSGVTSVIPDCDLRRPGDINPTPVLAQIEREGVTRTAASPAFIDRLLQGPNAAAAGARLSQVFTGGAPVFPSLLQRIRATWPACEPVAVYGSTEAEPIAEQSLRTTNPADISAMCSGKGLLAGRPVSCLQLAILPIQWGTTLGPFSSAEFQMRQLTPGATGEIVVSGEHVVCGYLQGLGDTETKFNVEGQIWHRTGDAGYLDSSGRLWLTGRCSARIIDLHGELHPFAVECAAMQFDWVRLAGCVGVGGKRCLAIEPRRVPTQAEITQLRTAVSLAQIDQLCVVDKMPVDRRHNAKIDYQQLAALLSSHACDNLRA